MDVEQLGPEQSPNKHLVLKVNEISFDRQYSKTFCKIMQKSFILSFKQKKLCWPFTTNADLYAQTMNSFTTISVSVWPCNSAYCQK